MSTDGWYEFNGVELVNLSRTVQLASALGIDTVRIPATSVEWIGVELGVGSDENYSDISQAPWYDINYPASAEFAGIIPLTVDGTGTSTLTSTPIEYTTDGGNSGRPHNATLPLVWNVVIVAQTPRGAEFGKRWMDKVLRNTSNNSFCAGSDLRFFRYPATKTSWGWDVGGWDMGGWDEPEAQGIEKIHYRNVRTTRGSSVTGRRERYCSALLMATFTMTAADPYQYGEQIPLFAGLGGSVSGPDILSYGSTALVETSCPVYNYSPVYDPLYPALVPSPSAPNLLPAGWDIFDGMTFDRLWVRVPPLDPISLTAVPVLTLTTDEVARMVRVSVWPSGSDPDDQCDPLFSVVVSYLPPDFQFVIDGEQQAAYVWDGVSPNVRRTDSLIYSPDAGPMKWVSFNDPEDLLVTLDIFSESGSGGYEGGGTVRVDMSLVAKSD